MSELDSKVGNEAEEPCNCANEPARGFDVVSNEEFFKEAEKNSSGSDSDTANDGKATATNCDANSNVLVIRLTAHGTVIRLIKKLHSGKHITVVMNRGKNKNRSTEKREDS